MRDGNRIYLAKADLQKIGRIQLRLPDAVIEIRRARTQMKSWWKVTGKGGDVASTQVSIGSLSTFYSTP
ncbi:hypothetical protein J2R76_004119 [Bradyrhizobium sp. USDA 4532]|uniref:hypothetical protein n=1 Tax=unclassified Bradyrhizobium TaxID=2631580 RepID=UPI0020A22488|nr:MULTISPECIES: hypothetical protein [unclassified Bradyrhizobium]MCP1835779.1 hypothetical protein [Bradyrhizobium sp. USDA 4545]MCP1920528.1 hypothetical protein [Bradyrhizobium sp. USDA 4532]